MWKNLISFIKFQMVGDRMFVVDCIRTAKMQTVVSTAPVYFYRFSYRGHHSLSDYYIQPATNYGKMAVFFFFISYQI